MGGGRKGEDMRTVADTPTQWKGLLGDIRREEAEQKTATRPKD